MDIEAPMYSFLMRFYRHGEMENPRFFRRLNHPDLTGLRVLEVGCGTGSLAVYMVEKLGAAAVTACDYQTANIEFARCRLAAESPELVGRIEYTDSHIENLIAAGESFDAVVCKDVFEHIIDFPAALSQISRLLKPGGRLLSGWGPLYYSPRGGHGLTRIPYDHLLPERYLVSRYNRTHPQDPAISSVRDYGVNKLTYRTYRRELSKLGFVREFWGIDCCESFAGRCAGLLARLLPYPLCEPLIFNVYIILRKPASN